MKDLEIIIPVKNEAGNLIELVRRVNNALVSANIFYNLIFIDDHSTDKTVQIIESLRQKYPIKIFTKLGKPGKAYSILEGSRYATAENLAMLDADLQYPPEAIPEMFEKLNAYRIVVASRKTFKAPFIRNFLSKVFKFVFGKLLFDFNIDVQSGLKLFKKEIIGHLSENDISAWTIDLPLLHTAKELGYEIGEVKVEFSKRLNGKSHISLIPSVLEIGTNALLLKARRRKIYPIAPEDLENMNGSGIAHKGKRFITHTTLDHRISSITTFSFWQREFLYTSLFFFVLGLFFNSFLTLTFTLAILSTIYFVDVLFNLYLILRSLHNPPEIHISDVELAALNDKDLPIYSILCPLYKEARVLPHFIESIKRLDYLKEKLDVQLLLEEDDTQTIETVKNLKLPEYVRVNIVPHTMPKTKPKACNFGLNEAKGEYLVIFDAEDEPEPMQLKKAYLAFQKVKDDVVCLQAKLNYYNPHQNLLTRFFTAEYSLWFDVILPGLQTIKTNIPLGGTSNHFRTKTLLDLKGWDPFNVTEDCDLGVRLFSLGKKTAIINSETLEEANSNFKNWIRQRSRWIKGYMQTYLVHTRSPAKLFKDQGLHALAFQLIVGGKIAFLFINPVLWAATIAYFAFYSIVGPTIESLYSPIVFYMAIFSAVFGNFLYLYYYMIGCAKRGHWTVIKFVYFVPFYWLMGSVAAFIALYQLLFKPHYWEKTIHGFHHAKVTQDQFTAEIKVQKAQTRQRRLAYIQALARSGMTTGGALIAASIFANFVNLAYNAYLGNRISVEDFGLISLVGSFFYLSTVPVGALSKTITHRTAFLLGKYGIPLKQFWSYVRLRAIVAGMLATIIWLTLIPILAVFFKSPSYNPFLLFAPVWFIGITAAVDSGFLGGNLKFTVLAILILVESILKFLVAFAFVESGNSHLVYAATPIAMAIAFLVGWFFVTRIRQERKIIDSQVLNFPKNFFVTSIFTKFSTAAFLSFDLIMAKHFLPPQEAGLYALLSLVGKMVFFSGSLFSQFINPLVSREEGADRKSSQVFNKLFFTSIILSFAAYLVVGLFGVYTVPLLLGEKVGPLLYLLPIYGLAMFCFSIASSLVTYYQVRRKYLLSFVSLFLAFGQILAIYFYHANLEEIVIAMTAIGLVSLITTILLHIIYEPLSVLGRNIIDLLDVITFSTPKVAVNPANLRILIFNWRDTKHIWAGGAEIYIHELAKRWVKEGSQVTVFSGNDSKSPRNEIIDGVQIYRRGGFYMVYVWAFLYYILKFRGKFDIIIDSENGIPFFTPLYAKEKKFLLIHHVHQEVFMTDLKFPLAEIARFLEGKVMPFVYRNSKVITVSESSKQAIEGLGLGKNQEIAIVSPGVDIGKFETDLKKTLNPSLLYLGRLKPYKSLDKLIGIMEKVKEQVPGVTLTIAGDGESRDYLERLVQKLGLGKVIKFIGVVSEKTKIELFARSWTLVQPSRIEGWGITVIEANAAGTTVIASDVPGLRDSVQNPHTGLLVTWDNQEKWIDAICKVLKDKEFRSYLETNSKEWVKQFSWEKSAQEFYNKCLKTEN